MCHLAVSVGQRVGPGQLGPEPGVFHRPPSGCRWAVSSSQGSPGEGPVSGLAHGVLAGCRGSRWLLARDCPQLLASRAFHRTASDTAARLIRAGSRQRQECRQDDSRSVCDTASAVTASPLPCSVCEERVTRSSPLVRAVAPRGSERQQGLRGRSCLYDTS